MAANVEAMVRAGIEAYRAGKQTEARKLLEKAIELDDYNEQAWMWLSAVVETEEEKRTCLENVVVINPDNEEAKRGLKMLGVDGGGKTPAPSDDSSAPNPFTDTGMNELGDVDFAKNAGVDDLFAAPTATSSASSVYQGPETSSGEYDAWVDNLNLGGSGSQPVESPTANTVVPSNIDDMFGLDDSDDIFGTNDPFGSEIQFDMDDMDDSSAFTSGPFGDSSDDDFDMDDSPSPVVQSNSSNAPVQSPGAENISDDNFLTELAGADLSGGDFIMGDSDFDSDAQPDFSPDELFSFIPDEIRATRLPGTKQGVSVGSIIILVVLVMMNLGALIFIMSPAG
jgi:hypothetical protein